MKLCFACSQPVENPVHGLHRDCFVSWFKLDTDGSTDFDDVALKAAQADTNELRHINSSFFHGKFKKYAARLNKRSYILKVQDKDYPELPRVEYLCNQIAAALGLNTPDFYLIRLMNETDAFVVHNFMDNYKPGNLIHIYHFLDASESFSCQNLIKVVEEKVGRIEEMKQFVWMCLLDALIGNHDRHGRNTAFIETPKGFTLAPLYDNPSYLGIEEEGFLLARHNPKGKISTRHTDEPTMQDYVREFKNYEDWIKEFQQRVQHIAVEHMIANSFVSNKRQQALVSLITNRIKEMNDALVS